MVKFATEENFYKFLQYLQQSYQVILPQKKGSIFIFAPWQENSFIKFDYPTTIIPPSKLFIPNNEIIFSFQEENISAPPKPNNIALIGVTLYDVEAIALLDKIYSNDPNYIQRRENSLIFGYKRKIGCDLYERKKSPNYLSAADLIFEKNKNGYTIESLNPKSEKLLKLPYFINTTQKLSQPFICPDPIFLNIKKLSRALEKSLNSPVWKDLVKRCYLCGNCSFVCPLCYCYEVEDKMNLDGKSGERFRRWDSCFFPKFAEVAGGFNFRDKKFMRIYHWYFHKFVRAPYERIGIIDCVGCNRCTIFCPAKINFRTEIGKILEEYE